MTAQSGVVRRGAAPESLGRRLESWKEIASYLNRHVTTVRRWERLERLPVHRHVHGTLGSVYAYTHELDAWFDGRRSAAQTLALAPASPALEGPPQLPPLIAFHAPSPSALIGRDSEWSTLAARWEATQQGRHQLVLLTGDPGIGKTRLAFDFARSVGSRARVLVGRCDSEGVVPFAPFVEVVRWLVQTSHEGVLHSHLADVEGLGELTPFVPELARRVRAKARSVPATPEGRRYRLFESVAGLLRATAAARPVLLLIEDLHWADRGSMLLLRHLVRGVHDAPICTIVTHHASEGARSSWAGDVLSDLHGEPSTTRITLVPLPEQHVRDLVTACMSRPAAPHVATAIAGSTHGNPLFIVEMVRQLEDPVLLSRLENSRGNAAVARLELPQSVKELIARRLSGLGEESRKLLILAAVAGREFDVATLETASGLPEETVLDAMDHAVACSVLQEVSGAPGRFLFAHAVVRDVLYGLVTAARRVRLHHRVAEAIEQQHGSGDARLADLAHHFSEAAPFKNAAAKAADYATRAGEQAASTLALEEAARYYEMALRALDFSSPGPALRARRFGLHERRGRSFFQVGDWAAAKRDYEAALALLEPDAEVARCELLVRLAETAFWLMDVPGIRRFAAEAQRLAEAVQRDDLWADAQAWAASADVADGDVGVAVESDRRAVARARGIRSFGLARVPLTLYWAGQTAEAVERAAEAVERGRASGDPAFLLYALQHSGLSLSGAGRYDEAFQAFDEAVHFGRRCGSLPLLARALSMSVAPMLGLGWLEQAAMRALEARELAHRIAFEPPFVSAGIDLLVISARSGDPWRTAPLIAEVGSAVERAAGWHGWKWRLRLWQARAELALARGDWNEALIAAGHVVDQGRARKRMKYEALGLWARARAEARLGLGDARSDARDATRVARTLGDPAVLLTCLALQLEIDRSAQLEADARETVGRIVDALPQDSLRRRFLAGLSPVLARATRTRCDAVKGNAPSVASNARSPRS